MAKKNAKQTTDLSRSLNYIRAYVPTTNIVSYLELTPDTIRKIASGQSKSNEKTRLRIMELEAQTKRQVKARQVEFLAKANDKRFSQNSRSLARDRARDLEKANFTFQEASRRQFILKEQALPYTTASNFFRQYSEGKSVKQMENELKRFTERGQELLVTNYKGDVFFSRKPLLRSSLVHPRGVVYINNFSDGYDRNQKFFKGVNQVVRDLSSSYGGNLSLSKAQAEGKSYFERAFGGEGYKEVNEKLLNNDLDVIKSKTKSRGEKYKDLSSWLIERMYLGIYLY